MTSFSKEANITFRRSREGHVVRRKLKKAQKSSYKHVPHSEKPPHVVAKRNARERRRVETVNNAFLRLRRHVPLDTKHKRLSKVKTLRLAIDYIKRLTEVINRHDKQYGAPCCSFGRPVAIDTVCSQPSLQGIPYRTREFTIETETQFGAWIHPFL